MAVDTSPGFVERWRAVRGLLRRRRLRARAARVPDPAKPDLSGLSRRFARGFFWLGALPVRVLFRLRFEGLEHLRLDRPGIIVSNHNLGCWGSLESFAMGYVWYWLQADPPDLVHQGGTVFYKLPFGPTLARRVGAVPASVEGMRTPLREGRWIHVQPGALVDQYRPIWLRNRPRLKKVSWIGRRRVLSDQLAYAGVAVEGGHPIYPLAVSGSQEITPILWESVFLLRWTGLRWLRRDEDWPSFPITLNHVVNLVVFLLTPFAASAWAWGVFLLANVYVDWVYLYPLFPVQLRMRLGEPIEPRLPTSPSVVERLQEYRRTHRDVVQRLDDMLDDIEASRPWRRLARGIAHAFASPGTPGGRRVRAATRGRREGM
jgi:1-acyl-sn-glycerol-3-phosphate acyltransferase